MFSHNLHFAPWFLPILELFIKGYAACFEYLRNCIFKYLRRETRLHTTQNADDGAVCLFLENLPHHFRVRGYAFFHGHLESAKHDGDETAKNN